MRYNFKKIISSFLAVAIIAQPIAINAKIYKVYIPGLVVTDSPTDPGSEGSGLILSTNSLQFNDTLVGEEVSLQIQVTNLGQATPLNITTGTDTFAATHNCGTNLATNSSCIVNVRFVPNAGISYSGILTVTPLTGSAKTASLTGSGLGAALTANPSPVQFGSVELGKNTEQTITVSNTGNRNAILAVPQILNTEYTVTNNSCVGTLSQGQYCSITVNFAPSAAGDRVDVMKLVANTGTGNTTTNITLRGTGLDSLVQIQSSLNFSEVDVGTTSTKPVAIVNKGNTTISVNAVGSLAAPFAAAGCTGDLPPGAVCNIPVSFSPATVGPFQTTLQIIENGNIHTVAVSGSGVKKALVSLSPNNLLFSETTVGQISDPQVVVLKNTGQGVLGINGFSVGTNYVVSTTCASIVNPQETCDYLIALKPLRNGSQPSTLTINTSIGDSRVDLSGLGVGGNTALELSSTSIEFDKTEVGASSSDKSVLVLNPTASTVAIQSVTTTGPYTAISSCENAIDPSTSCAINVKFAPGTTGQLPGSLVLNTSTGVSVVSLSGIGTAPVLTVLNTQLDWGVVSGLTEIPAKIVNVKSTGGLPVSIGNILISTSKFTSTTNCPAILNDDQTCAIAVTPSSDFEGLSTAILSIDSSSFKPVKPVELSAANNTYVAQAQSSGINFGNLPLSAGQNNAAVQDIVIQNIGVAPMTLTGIAPSVEGVSVASNNCTSIAPNSSCVLGIAINRSNPLSLDKTFKTTGQGVNTEFAIKAEVQGISVSWGRTVMDMGYTPTGSTLQSTVQLVNSGNISADLRSITLSGSGFSLNTSACAAVNPLQSCAVIATFAPQVSTDYTASVTSITSPSGPVIVKNNLLLSGTSLSTVLSSSTNSLDIGTVAIESQSAEKTVRIQNTGDNDVSGFSATVGKGFIATTNCPQTIPAGTYCDISVKYSAVGATEGPVKGNLTITSKAPTLIVGLTAYVSQPLQASPSAAPTSISAPNMTFGKVALNSTKQKSIYVVAQGTSGQLVSSMTITGTNASEFVVVAANKINPTSLVTGSCTTSSNAQTVVDCTADAFTNGNFATTASAIQYVIEARPVGASGDRTALLTIQYNNNVIQTFPITLTAPSLAKASVSTNTLTFDPTDVGSSSQLTVRLANTGTEALLLSSAPQLTGSTTFTFPQTGGTTCQTQLAPGAYCDTTVVFTPVNQDVLSGSLVFNSNDEASPTIVSLSAEGLRGYGELKAKSPSTGNFGPVNIGSTQTQSFTFTNKGNKAVSGAYATLVAAPSSLTIIEGQSTCGTNDFKASIAAGANCTITVNYAPLKQGETLSNVYLQVASTAVNSPTQIAVLGSSQGTVSLGVTNTGGSAITGYDFGTVSNLAPATYVVRATNTGSSPIYFSATPGVTGDAAYTASTTCGSSLAVGSNCDVTVTFNPTSGTTVTGQVKFESNAGSSPNTVNLSGKGAIASATATAVSTYDFGTISTGLTSTRSIKITNTGTVPLTGITASLTDATLTQSGNNCGGSIVPGGVCTISVLYSPTTAGTIAANAVSFKGTAISTNDLTITPASQFTGSAVVPSLIYTDTGGATITSYNAGNVNNGSTSATTTVKLVNNTSVAVSPSFNNPGSGFNVDSSACTTVPANSSCNINLSFTASGPGTMLSNLIATVGNTSKTLNLSGTGVVTYNKLATSLSMTISNGGLRASGPTSANPGYAAGGIALSKGSAGYYFEVKNNSATSRTATVGLITTTTSLRTYNVPKDGNVYGFAIDMNSSSFVVYNVTAGCSVVASSTFNTAWNNLTVGVIAAYTSQPATVDFNFGQSALSCVPMGYKLGVY